MGMSEELSQYIRRGQVYWIEDGYGKNGHMYIVLTSEEAMNDRFNQINVIQITSKEHKENKDWLVRIPANNLPECNQTKESYANCLRVYIFKKDKFIKPCGVIPKEIMLKIDKYVFTSLGLYELIE